jgi:predicted aldo/keto reductase-like oxidoreductase
MTAGEREEIERLRKELGNRFCRRCGYCQPCPEGISVQLIMILDSLIKRMPPDNVFADLSQVVDGAESCVECGECEEKCPYELPIREMIKEHVALFREEMAQAGFV